jgi:NAD+ diphosphatase
VTSDQRIALATAAHERDAHLRGDAAWLNAAWQAASTRVLLVARGEVPTLDQTVVWLRPDQAPEGTRVFLGRTGEVAHFAVILRAPTEDREWAGLRMIGALLGPDEIGLVVQAIALGEWHRRHRFCPKCGAGLLVESAGHILTCAPCGTQQFPRTDPAVIMLVTDGDRALLGRHPQWPTGRYSTLAGFVEPGESLEQAVAREVLEESGVRVTDVRYFASQPWPFPASLMVGFFAEAMSADIVVDGVEIEDAQWFTREEMRAQAEAGTLVLPGGLSISRALIEEWYGGPLPGSW